MGLARNGVVGKGRDPGERVKWPKTEIGSLRMKGDGAKLDIMVLVSPAPLHQRLQINKQLPRVLSLQLSISQTWRQLLSRGYFGGDFHEQ